MPHRIHYTLIPSQTYIMRALVLVLHAFSLSAGTKHIDRMSFGELLKEGKEALNSISQAGNLTHHPEIIRMQKVLNAFSKTLPLVTYDQSITPIERGADGLLHEIFHPVLTAQEQLHGLSWDIRHITEESSAFILLRGIAIMFCLYVIVGAMIMSKYYNANGIDRIPHVSFWLAYPGLVLDGITFVGDRLGFDMSSATYQRLAVAVGGKSTGARDTFSQFEPI